jgi:hypothetical protein
MRLPPRFRASTLVPHAGRLGRATCLVILSLALPATAVGENRWNVPSEVHALRMRVGQDRTIFVYGAHAVRNLDDHLAEATLAAPGRVRLVAKAPGYARVAVYTKEGIRRFRIAVSTNDLEALAAEARGLLGDLDGVTLRTGRRSLVLVGQPAESAALERGARLSERYPQVHNRLIPPARLAIGAGIGFPQFLHVQGSYYLSETTALDAGLAYVLLGSLGSFGISHQSPVPGPHRFLLGARLAVAHFLWLPLVGAQLDIGYAYRAGNVDLRVTGQAYLIAFPEPPYVFPAPGFQVTLMRAAPRRRA